MTTHQDVGYDPAHYEPLFAAEERHFWFTTRSRVIGHVMGQATADLADGFRVLEVGCGTGNVLRALDEACPRGRVVGTDSLVEGLVLARRRSRCPLVASNVDASPFAKRFHAVGLFDVIEHLEDDVGMLRAVSRLMEPGGVLLITVPAHMSLWSYFDVLSGHARRYAPAQLREALLRSGFEVDYMTQFMSLLFPMMWLQRRIHSWRAEEKTRPVGKAQRIAEEVRVVPGLNAMMKLLLSFELPVIARRGRLPLGTSLLALARLPERHERVP